MKLYTTEAPGEYRVKQSLGLAYGNSVRAMPATDDLIARMKNVLGGEVEEYTKLMGEAREQALDRLIAHAAAMGANAVIGLRFTSCEIAAGAAELLAYGTAVVVEE